MSSNFSNYADYYDLFNASKDYKKECKYVINLLKQSEINVSEIYDFGCGTGIHATEIAKQGFAIHGVDLSERMISIAEERLRKLSPEMQDRLKFTIGDLRNYQGATQKDAILSLFHVASYQVEDSDLEGYFASAATNLKPGGLFIFDYWYLPAMINLKLENRIREEDGEIYSGRRFTNSSWLNSNVVTVEFDIFIKNKITQEEINFQETHNMRGLSVETILKFMPKNLSHMSTLSWLTLEEPSVESWNAVSIFKKND